MELEEYRREFLTLVRVVAESDREGTVPSFVAQAANSLLDAGVIPDYEACFYTGTGRRNRRLRVDGYALDDFDMTMYLLIADYGGSDEPETLTMTQARTVFDRLYAFLDEVLTGSLHREMEISTPAYDLVENIRTYQARIRKYSFILLTDKIASERIETLPFGAIQGVPVEYHVWDMNRFHRVMESESGRDEIFIEFDDYIKGGIPCLEASSAQTDEYRSFLCVIPGNVLADIYDKYGSRLLEGNVRSFLSTKRAVNKKIRETILRQPKRFFAYNNGISATATDVEIERQENGLAVSSIRGLQIVNGGQTTASISNARFKDSSSLDNIYVQVKLTEVDPVLASSIIPDISRSSNSQNKVSEADFFSNHAFHIQMEKMSRRIFAPAVGGAQYETHWFYERANGQYLQEQSRMKKSEKNRFIMINPQKQKITKTDIAKYHNTWRGLPQKVSLGAQKNFAVFAEWITEEWEKHDTQFNELFFRQCVALAILFKKISTTIRQQPWYENGYLANLTAYSMAKLSYMLKGNLPDKELDLMQIWGKQDLPDVLCEQLIPIYKAVFNILTDQNRLIQNVTEWSKNNICWERVKEVQIQLHPQIDDVMMDKNDAKTQVSSARAEQRMISGIEAQMFVVEKGQSYWLDILSWAGEKKLLSPEESKILTVAGNMSGTRMPNEVQCRILQEVRNKVLAEGYQEI
jgi:hypothetical protein